MKGCKNCPAYDKCTATYRGSSCAALRYTYGIDSDPEITTNADRIRAMSDTELAEILTRYAYEAHGKWYGPDQKTYWSESKYALKAWLEWLRQPAEED